MSTTDPTPLSLPLAPASAATLLAAAETAA